MVQTVGRRWEAILYVESPHPDLMCSQHIHRPIVSPTNSRTFTTGYTAVARVRLQTHKLSRIQCTMSRKSTRTSIYNHPAPICLKPCLLAFSQTFGERPSVETIANCFQKVCYDNKDQLSAGIIVAGWDKQNGPSVYNIPVGGGLFRQPWAIGGMYFPEYDMARSSFEVLQGLDLLTCTVTVMRPTKKTGVETRRSSL